MHKSKSFSLRGIAAAGSPRSKARQWMLLRLKRGHIYSLVVMKAVNHDGTSPSIELRKPSQSLSPKRVGSGIRSFMKEAHDASKSQGATSAIATRLMMTARAAADGDLSRLIDFLYT